MKTRRIYLFSVLAYKIENGIYRVNHEVLPIVNATSEKKARKMAKKISMDAYRTTGHIVSISSPVEVLEVIETIEE